MVSSSLDQSKSERIYIGGLDPPRLCASDVLKRIQAIDQIEIMIDESESPSSAAAATNNEQEKNSNEILDKKPYLHITARSKNESSSALDIIAKQYHNVKWKGCKLAVETAKPHFLQRLDEERRQRSIGTVEEESHHEQQQKEEGEHDDTDEAIINDNNIPRRLRVRKKFGEEAYHIDTKPWTVEDWTNFQRARNKLRKQCENYKSQQQEQVNKKQQNTYGKDSKRSSSYVHRLMHRAVHFRFSDVVNDGRGLANNDVSDNEMNSSNSSNNSHSNKSGDSEEEMDHQAETPAKNETSYQWSDDEDDDDDDDDDSEDENVIEKFEVDQAVIQEKIKNSSSTSDDASSENENKNEFEDGDEYLSSEEEAKASSSPNNLKEDDDDQRNSTTKKSAREEKSGPKSYQWSTDEEESDDDYDKDDKESFSKAGLLTTIERAIVDEFAAGLDEDDEIDDEEDNLVDNGGKIDDVSRHESTLVEDVNANLNILSSIFPDMANARPASVADDHDNNKNSNSKVDMSREQSGLMVGQVSGIIPRYDPTMDSSEKYTIKEKSPVVDNSNDRKDRNDDEESSSGSDDDSDDSENDVVEDTTKIEGTKEQQQPVQNVYEQGKLESVFRDAREVWEKQPSHLSSGQVSTSKQSITTTSGGGAFTFGFDLDETMEKDIDPGAAKTTSGFSFSFNIPGSTQTTAKVSSKVNDISEAQKQSNTSFDVEDDKTIEEFQTLRRKGLEFPKEDLQEYVNNFFSCNEGQKILISCW